MPNVRVKLSNGTEHTVFVPGVMLLHAIAESSVLAQHDDENNGGDMDLSVWVVDSEVLPE